MTGLKGVFCLKKIIIIIRLHNLYLSNLLFPNLVNNLLNKRMCKSNYVGLYISFVCKNLHHYLSASLIKNILAYQFILID